MNFQAYPGGFVAFPQKLLYGEKVLHNCRGD